MPSLRDAAAEAFAAGWTLTGAPLTPSYTPAALAAIAEALTHPDDPAVLEVTLKIGSLKGAWATVFDRREKLTAEHTAAILAIWQKIIPHLNLQAMITRWWRTASLLTGDGRKAATREEATQAALGWLHAAYGSDSYPKLEAALTDALTASMAEGKAGMLAVAAEQHNLTAPVDSAYKSYHDQLTDLPDLPLMAQEWIQRMIGSSASDVGRVMANLAMDNAGPDDMARAAASVLTDASTSAVALFTDWAMGSAMAQASLSLYTDEGVGMVDWLTAGDDRVCAECQDFEDNGPYLPSQFPACPDHPRCRCTPAPADPISALSVQGLLDLIP